MSKELTKRIKAHDELFNEVMQSLGVDYIEPKVIELESPKSGVNYYIIFVAIVALLMGCSVTY